MRVVGGVLCLLLTLAPPAFGQDLRDTFLDVAQRELGKARIAEAPVVVGKRSPIGPQLYRRVVDSVILVVTKEAIGSGVVVTAKGHILTNWHVAGDYEVVGVVPRAKELLRGTGELRKEHISLPVSSLSTFAGILPSCT